jgi:hypothetical protein
MKGCFVPIALTCALLAGPVRAEELVFEGTWHTTNRKLDGNMTCAVTDLGNERWRGRFYGNWQGVPFDYTVAFSGPPSELQGTAKIDGADYTWTGVMSNGPGGDLKGIFGGNRYLGHFELKAKPGVTLKPK